MAVWDRTFPALFHRVRSLAKTIKEELLVERHRYRGLVLYEITGEQLNELETEALTVGEDLTFAVVALTAALSFLISLLTTKIESDRTFQFFLIVTILGFVGAFYFGIRWFRRRGAFKQAVGRIRQEAGPLGEEGEEIKREELESLPPQTDKP